MSALLKFLRDEFVQRMHIEFVGDDEGHVEGYRDVPESNRPMILRGTTENPAQGGRSGRLLPPENHNDMPRRTTPDPYAQQVGARIRELRHERNLSLAALAEASELSKGHLSSVEHGLAAITIGTIQRLAQGFELPPLYILAFAAEDEYAKIAELLRALPIAEVKKVRRQIQAQVGKKR